MKNILTIVKAQTESRFAKLNLIVALYLILLSLAVRLPFFFMDVIDWDESTYILIGQSILDGYNHDTDLFSLRGYPYALFIMLFGKSVEAIRFAGALCVAFISFFTYIIGKKIWDHRTALIGATLCILLSTLLPSGLATMSEHIALVPLIGALSLLVTQKINPRKVFVAGIFNCDC